MFKKCLEEYLSIVLRVYLGYVHLNGGLIINGERMAWFDNLLNHFALYPAHLFALFL
jgi:hypothetical protein